MSKIELTPEFLREQTPPIIHISKKLIIFNAAATKKLALNVNDRFILNLDGEKLQILPSASKGFQIKKSSSCLQASAYGLQEFLLKHLRVIPSNLHPTVSTLRFEIGDFNEGSNPLNYMSFNSKNKKN